MNRSFFYISDGKLFINDGNASKEIRSAVLDSYMKKLRESASRNEWKRSGEGARFTGAFESNESAESRIASVRSAICCIGKHNDRLIYSINIDGLTGIYSKDDLDSADEGIVISSADTSYRDFDIKNGRMAVSSAFAGESHIGILNVGSSDCDIYTDGRSYDSEPVWSKEYSDKLYFCTAGLQIQEDPEDDRYREPEITSYQQLIMKMAENNTPIQRGPSSICIMDIAQGTMEEILTDEKYDFLHPQSASDGSLYYIKRPHKSYDSGKHALGCLADVLLFPIRLLGALLGFFNFFSIKYSGKALSRTGDVKQKSGEQMFIDGNLIDAEREMKENMSKGDKFPGIIPRSWELHRLMPDGSDKLVRRGVVAYRIDESTDDILISNGSAIIRRFSDGSEEKISDAQRVTYIFGD